MNLHREHAVLDPESELHAAARLLEAGLGFASGMRAEIYLRSSRRVRASRTSSGSPAYVEEGLERGVAARVVDAATERSGFAAASGASEDAGRWVFRNAAESVYRADPVIGVGEGDRATVVTDHESARTLPDAGAVTAWLHRASEIAAQRLGGRRGGCRPRIVWVEVGFTVETLVTEAGLRTSRARRRAWALGVSRRWDLQDAPERARIMASSSLEGLDPGDWLATLEPGRAVCRRAASHHSGRLVLEPAAAAPLVRALVLAMHGPGGILGVPVGPGWRVRDDPGYPEALTGGAFDDVGAPASPRILADGREVGALLEGPGCFRRSSFRDAPAASSSHLDVEAGGSPLSVEPPVVTDLRVVPMESGSWTLVVDGYRRDAGGPAEVFLGARIHGTPVSLVRAIVGTDGPPRRTGEGVATPRLVLEGVKIEG